MQDTQLLSQICKTNFSNRLVNNCWITQITNKTVFCMP